MSSTTKIIPCSEPGAIVVMPSPNWIEAGDPGGVNCTPRVSGLGLKSMSSRQPRRW
jgi:hypothetical protein